MIYEIKAKLPETEPRHRNNLNFTILEFTQKQLQNTNYFIYIAILCPTYIS